MCHSKNRRSVHLCTIPNQIPNQLKRTDRRYREKNHQVALRPCGESAPYAHCYYGNVGNRCSCKPRTTPTERRTDSKHMHCPICLRHRSHRYHVPLLGEEGAVCRDLAAPRSRRDGTWLCMRGSVALGNGNDHADLGTLALSKNKRDLVDRGRVSRV